MSVPAQGNELSRALGERFAAVKAKVAAAAARAGRDPASILIVGVSKRHGADMIEAAHAAGIRDLGENYAQELDAKLTQIGGRCARELSWHFIGHLQRNKVKLVLGRVALIHTVDNIRLAEELSRRAQAQELSEPQRVLIEVNVSGEATKSGIVPDRVEELLAAVARLPLLACEGLMTMPPLDDHAETARPYFRRLAELRERLKSASMPLAELSMGTTGDYEVAVEEGATIVRVGTAIFGPRA